MDETYVRWLMADEFGLEADELLVPAWYAEAACAGQDSDEWFPGRGDDWRVPVAVCEDCPVRQECLDHALDVEAGAPRAYRFGIWGGTTPNQRDALDREDAAA